MTNTEIFGFGSWLKGVMSTIIVSSLIWTMVLLFCSTCELGPYIQNLLLVISKGINDLFLLWWWTFTRKNQGTSFSKWPTCSYNATSAFDGNQSPATYQECPNIYTLPIKAHKFCKHILMSHWNSWDDFLCQQAL